MSQTEDTDRTEAERDALERAIAENPEAVAGFVERLDSVNELLDVLALAESALDDEMVASLARTGGGLGELADVAGERETVEGAQVLLQSLGEAAADPPERVSTVGLLRRLRDSDVREGLAFLLAVAKGVGAERRRRSRAEQRGDR